ncbi:MAG TPA: hypothetical protein V6C96_04270 [Vampirovibrionales bacterium]
MGSGITGPNKPVNLNNQIASNLDDSSKKSPSTKTPLQQTTLNTDTFDASTLNKKTFSNAAERLTKLNDNTSKQETNLSKQMMGGIQNLATMIGLTYLISFMSEMLESTGIGGLLTNQEQSSTGNANNSAVSELGSQSQFSNANSPLSLPSNILGSASQTELGSISEIIKKAVSEVMPEGSEITNAQEIDFSSPDISSLMQQQGVQNAPQGAGYLLSVNDKAGTEQANAGGDKDGLMYYSNEDGTDIRQINIIESNSEISLA